MSSEERFGEFRVVVGQERTIAGSSSLCARDDTNLYSILLTTVLNQHMWFWVCVTCTGHWVLSSSSSPLLVWLLCLLIQSRWGTALQRSVCFLRRPVKHPRSLSCPQPVVYASLDRKMNATAMGSIIINEKWHHRVVCLTAIRPLSLHCSMQSRWPFD